MSSSLLLDDVYSVIDVEGKLGGALEECVGGYDLIYNGGAVKSDKQSCYSNSSDASKTA